MDWREIIESYKIMRDKEKAKSDWLLLASSRANTKGGQIKSACGMSSTWKKKKTKKTLTFIATRICGCLQPAQFKKQIYLQLFNKDTASGRELLGAEALL